MQNKNRSTEAWKKDRRLLLKSIGLGMASPWFLPLLKGTMSTEAYGQSTSPKRLLIIPLQHGWGLHGEDSLGSERDFTLPSWFSPLEPLKDKLVLVDGLMGTWWGNAHDVSYTDILTGSVPAGAPDNGHPTIGAQFFPMPTGPSIDHVISEALGLNAMRLNASYGSWGLQAHPLSFDNNLNWLEPYLTPSAAFNLSFNGILQAAQMNSQDLGEINNKRRRLLDFLRHDINRMQSRLPSFLSSRLDTQLGAIDTLAANLGLNGNGQTACTVPSAPPVIQDPAGSGFETTLDEYFKIMETAMICQTHQVFVFGIGDHFTNFSWNDLNGASRIGADPSIIADHFIDTNGDYQPDTHQLDPVFQDQGFHHDVAHYNQPIDDWGQTRRLAFNGWIRWHVNKVAQFAQALNNITDVDGSSMLDNTAIVLTGEVSTGEHNTGTKGITVIGGSNFLDTGRYIRPAFGDGNNNPWTHNVPNWYPRMSSRSESDFWVGLAQAMGVQLSSFGLAERNSVPIDLGKGV